MDWIQKAQTVIKEEGEKREKKEYSLRLEVEQESQEIEHIRQGHQKTIRTCTEEYEQFKRAHAAHAIVQDIHSLQNKVHQLEANQQALLAYIKFGELK